MTLAAIIPYYHPRGPGSGRVCSCIVVIPRPGLPPEEWPQAEIEVGRVECLDHRRYPCAECSERQGAGRVRLFMRIVGPAEVAAVVARVVEMLEEHRVPGARVELPAGPGVEDERGKAIVTALHESGTPTFLRLVPAAKGDLTARLAALLKSEGPDAVGRATEPLRLGAPVLDSFQQDQGASRSGKAPHGRGPCLAVPREAEHDAAPSVAQAPKAARRVLGVDPGARWIHLSIIEGEVVPVRWVASLPIEVGHVVSLRTPKVITRSNGTTYEKTERRVIDDADVARAQREAVAFAQAHGVDDAVVESATFVYEGAGALLMRAQRIGGVIEGALRAAGLPVATRSSREWRATVKRMVGLRVESVGGGVEVTRGLVSSGDVGGALVDQTTRCEAEHESGEVAHAPKPSTWRPAVRALVSGLPATLDEHGLDATGAALSAVAPKVAPKPARARTPGGKGYDAEGQRTRREAKRRALGCPCATGRHEDPECPIRVAKLAKVSQKMMGNQNAKRGA